VVTENYDVIVLGVGVMGSAACYQLARRGIRAIGIEQFHLAHDMGSSHGRTRVIRKAYFEDERYVPLLQATYDEWREIEAASEEKLMHLVGCLNVGPADHESIRGARHSAEKHKLSFEVLDKSEMAGRWPGLDPSERDVGIFEQEAGYLLPEQSTLAMARLAESKGCRIVADQHVLEWSANDSGVTVKTQRGAYSAAKLIITAGPWLPGIVADLGIPLRVERQVQLWFSPIKPELFTPDRFPAFIHFVANRGYYGIPSANPPWIKVARHHGGVITTANDVDRRILPSDEADARWYMQRHLRGADGPRMDGKVCLYTNTADDHFIIDRHPRHANVLIAGGFSGHGFKFAPVVGRVLSDMATDQKPALPIEMFALARLRP
jgi:sarcosine oxidase